MKTRSIISLFVLLAGPMFGQQVDHWELLVDAQDSVYFYADSTALPFDWYKSGANDTNWTKSIGSVGYGDGDDNTIIAPVNRLYLEYRFGLTDSSHFYSLALFADYDDAFVAYLNGVEIARANLGTNGSRVGRNRMADASREAQLYQDGPAEYYEANSIQTDSVLRMGDNRLSVLVLNDSESSSDLTGIFYLTASSTDTFITNRSFPAFLREPVSDNSSTLPILSINTQGLGIPDEPKIPATLRIYDQNRSGINTLEDSNYMEYHIGIEKRGASSQLLFPKKSYGFETVDSSFNEIDVSLLGFAKEEDWILNGPYSDRSMIRNQIVYQLGREMGHWNPATKYVELYINGKYQGLYIFMEKIKRDKNRLNLEKLGSADTLPKNIGGGYIIKIDKVNGAMSKGWYSKYESSPSAVNVFFQIEYPREENLKQKQSDYIRKYFDEFEATLSSPDFRDSEKGYENYIDLNSFIDFFIANEITYNVDGYRISTFLHKDQYGKLKMGPLWDFNLSMGNGFDCENQNEVSFLKDFTNRCPSRNFPVPFWWDRLMEDPQFRCSLVQRWNELRSGVLSERHLNYLIDSSAAILNVPERKNDQKWDTYGFRLWPNTNVPESHSDEIEFVRNWMKRRMAWLDVEIEALCPNQNPVEDLLIYPNPFLSEVNFRVESRRSDIVNLNIYDVQGKRVLTSSVSNTFYDGNIELSWDGRTQGGANLSPGVYIYELNVEERTFKGKIIKKE